MARGMLRLPACNAFAEIGPVTEDYAVESACRRQPEPMESPDSGALAMKIGLVGCGFVADLYMRSLEAHPELELVCAADRNPARAEAFAAHWSVPTVDSVDALLADASISLIVNLTNPSEHYTVNRQCLEAGRHVYCEKPLAMDFEQARELVDLAASRGLQLSGAPCSLLSESAQTLWKAIRDQRVGPIRLVYAEMDDDFVPKAPVHKWHSESGAPWPWKDEYEVGCTLEHAGYYLTWLAAFFGPAQSVTAFSSIQVPDKGQGALDVQTPDFSVACIQFPNNVVCRLTCSIVAPHDHRLTVVGDEGVLTLEDCWFNRAPIRLRKRWVIRRKMLLAPLARKLLLKNPTAGQTSRRGAAAMDFALGIAELAQAIETGRAPLLNAEFSLHVTELALAIQAAGDQGGRYELQTQFTPLTPPAWVAQA